MRFPGGIGIRRLALVSLIALSLLTVTLTTALLTLRSTIAQRSEATARMNEAAASLAQFVNSYVADHQRAVQLSALTLQNPDTDPQSVIDHLQTQYPGLLSALATNAAGDVMAIAVRDVAGDIDPSRLIGSSIADRSYFTEARERGQPYVSPVFRGRGVGSDWIVALSAPVQSQDGTFAGIVEGSLDLGRIGEQVAASRTLNEVSYSVRDAANAQLFGRYLGPSQDLSVVATTAHRWTVELTLPDHYSNALMASQVGSGLLIGILVLAISIWMAWLLARQISRPIEGLTRVIRRFKPGMSIRFGRTVRHAPREVQSLGDSFDSLTKRLSESLARQQALREEESRLRKTLENEVKNREAIIEERTLELADQNLKLHRLAVEAQQAARSKTVFLATMSHELRTPLAAIVGFAELLTTATGDDRSRREDLSASLKVNAHKLSDTINRVLDISALDDGTVRLDVEVVDLASLMEAVREAHWPAARRKGLSVELDCQRLERRQVLTDADRLAEVLDQIIDNAIKFTRHGTVTVNAQTLPDDGWRIDITDTGCGIEAAHLRHVCDRFFQVDQQDNRNFGGTGLGLSIAHELCQLMDLELKIVSHVDQGTTVSIIAPGGPQTRSAPMPTTATAEPT